MATKSAGGFTELFGPKKLSARMPSPYRAVSIVPGASTCGAVCRLGVQRFLARQAPPLPLPGCDVKSCTCRFKHHRDRRAGPRRHNDAGMTSSGTGKERRQSRGRRAEDQF